VNPFLFLIYELYKTTSDVAIIVTRGRAVQKVRPELTIKSILLDKSFLSWRVVDMLSSDVDTAGSVPVLGVTGTGIFLDNRLQLSNSFTEAHLFLQ